MGSPGVLRGLSLAHTHTLQPRRVLAAGAAETGVTISEGRDVLMSSLALNL